MKPAAMALVMLLLFAGASLAEAGRQPRDAKGSWGRHGYRRQDHNNSRQPYGHFPVHRDDARKSSRRRRRRSKSDSRSPDKCPSSKKPAEAKESPGYLKYKQQKLEAQQWQERRLQAQALAMCLEEREQQKLQAQLIAGRSSQPPAGIPPLPHPSGSVAPAAVPSRQDETPSSSATPMPRNVDRLCWGL